MLHRLVDSAVKPTVVVQQCRNLRNYWREGYLKDLYNRRQLVGAEPPTPRSELPNWNYPAELFAFKHRINAPDLGNEELQRVLTNPTFFDKRTQEATFIDEDNDEPANRPDNCEFVNKGEHRILWQISAILRQQWPKAPEEFIRGVVEILTSTESLFPVAEQLGLQHIVRTAEYPVSAEVLVDAFKAVAGALDSKRVHSFVCEYILPQLADVAFEDVLPFRDPLPVVQDYLQKWNNATEVEPRILHSHGVNTAMPLYIVGIYADKQLVGRCTGETISTAVDLAAQQTLLNLWGVRWNEQSLAFLDHTIAQHHFEKPNHHIAGVVQKSTNLEQLTPEELRADPLNVYKLAHDFDTKIYPEVGMPVRRHLRHKFSRGTLAKRSLRRLVKPKVFTI